MQSTLRKFHNIDTEADNIISVKRTKLRKTVFFQKHEKACQVSSFYIFSKIFLTKLVESKSKSLPPQLSSFTSYST